MKTMAFVLRLFFFPTNEFSIWRNLSTFSPYQYPIRMTENHTTKNKLNSNRVLGNNIEDLQQIRNVEEFLQERSPLGSEGRGT